MAETPAPRPGVPLTPEPPLPERIGRFSIRGVLGRGGMGVVFDADTPEGERVALKVIQSPGDSGRRSTLIARFLREARILEQLDHPGVVRLVDAGDMDGTLYLAMDRIEGVSLLAIRRQGPLNFEPVVQLGVHISDALAHMHAAGVVHRDIKPANILIKNDGQPVITDFGISGMSEATGITRQGDLLGSPGFMAPEVVNGAAPTALSDQYALGRLLFELGARGPSRRLPRKAPIFEILRMAQEIDWARFPVEGQWPQLAGILERMLMHDPVARYPDAAAAKAAIESLGRTVLDTETLSEHVDQLALPSSTSYEALAQDLLSQDPDAPGDAILHEFERPAGARPAPGPAAKPAWAAAPVQLPEPPDGADDFLADSDSMHEADITRIDDPSDTLPPGTVPTSEPASQPEFAAVDHPDTQRLEETVPLDLSLPAGVPGRPSEEAMPLAELIAQRETTEIPMAPSPEAAEVDRLERQLVLARDQIAALRKALNEPPKPSPKLPWILLAMSALVVGAVVGNALPEAPPRGPTVVLLPSDPRDPIAAKYDYAQGEPPSLQQRADAITLLEQAQEHLAKRDLDAAERVLGLCIEVANLPDCHRTLATMLAITRAPEAAAHFRQYLELAPDAPDANAIRTVLDASRSP